MLTIFLCTYTDLDNMPMISGYFHKGFAELLVASLLSERSAVVQHADVYENTRLCSFSLASEVRITGNRTNMCVYAILI